MSIFYRGPLALGLGILLLANSVSLAAPGDINSTNTGQNVQGGTYFNTPGSRTTFINNNGSLQVQSGVLVRGLESNAGRTPTGNGGTFYFRAPNNVIRIDGTVDVSAVRNGSTYLGNGGKAFFDSAFLFQNGNVFANGFNGGVMQYNVGGMTVGPNARITAQGFGGNGGSITINSPGAVDIRSGAILDSSGKVTGTLDTNVINVVGSVVNNAGIIRANGIAGQDFKGNNGDSAVISANPNLVNNPRPGTITGGQGTGVVMGGQPADFMNNPPPDFRGGTIRLVATGQSFNTSDAINRSTVLSSTLKNDLNSRQNNLRSLDGTVLNAGTLQANGASGRVGGSVLVNAMGGVRNSGIMQANGGNGGTVALLSLQTVENNGRIEANGSTQNGNGGLIGLAFNRLDNDDGVIRANGRNGGLVAFVGTNAPSGQGFGIVQAAGVGGTAGTILTPRPDLVPSSVLRRSASFELPRGARQARLLQSRNNELLLHQENALLLSQHHLNGATPVTLIERLNASTIRTVAQPNGLSANPVDTVKNKSNILIGGTNASPLVLNFNNANTNPIFTRPMALMIANNGDVTNNMHWSPGVMQVGPGFHDNVSSLGGGHISILSRGTITNNGFLLTRGLWSGGHINLAATTDVRNNRVILNTAFNKELATGYAPAPGLISSHSGGSILKAGRNVVNGYRLNSNFAFYDIHPALNNPDLIFPLFLNGAQIGATNYLLAGNTVFNAQGAHISSDVLTYRRGTLGQQNPANSIGGILTLQGGGGVINNGSVTVRGRAFQGFMDNRTDDGPRFPVGTTFAQLRPAASQEGTLLIK